MQEQMRLHLDVDTIDYVTGIGNSPIFVASLCFDARTQVARSN